MVNLENYITDGMPWQAQMVLAFIRGHYTYAVDGSYDKKSKDYKARIYVTNYNNGREHGYVVSVRYDYKKQKNYAFYEHCVSDNICLVMSYAFTDYSNGWDGKEWSKYEHDMDFDCYDAVGCGKFIVEDIRKQIGKWEEEESDAYNEEKQELLGKIRFQMENGRVFEYGDDDPTKVFNPIYCGERRRERIDHLYLDEDGNVVVVTYYSEDGEEHRCATDCSEFSNDEIKVIMKLVGV